MKGPLPNIPDRFGWLWPVVLIGSLPVVVIGGMLAAQLLALLLGVLWPVVLPCGVVTVIIRRKHWRVPGSGAGAIAQMHKNHQRTFTDPLLTAYLRDHGLN